MIQVAVFCESKQQWRWTEERSMADAVRATIGVRAWIVTDPTGYCIGAADHIVGDLSTKYYSSKRTLKLRGNIE